MSNRWRPDVALAAALVTAVGACVHAAGLYPTMQSPFVTWIENGRPRAEIMGEANAPAAKELNVWLKRITGTELPIAATPTSDRPHVFVGGKAAWKRLRADRASLNLGSDGYVIRTVGRDLVIAGETPLAVMFGVTAFLERYLDCRWFWPGENGMYYPSRATLQVGRIDEVSRPHFRVRWIIRDAACARFNRLNVGVRCPGEFRIQWFVHTWLRLVPPTTYWATNPEFYAEIGGQRKDPTAKRAQVNLCTTNPQVAEAAAKTIDQVVANSPDISMVSVDPMDTQQFCQCANCKRVYDAAAPYERRASRLVFEFTNRVAELVAKKHPKLLIKTIAYHTYLAPPAEPGFRLRDNVAVQFCRFMCHNHRLNDPNCAENRHFNIPLIAWTKLSRHVMLYEYYYKASWCGLPWPIVHTLKYDIPYLRRLGVMGVASQWNRNSAANGLAFYVASKLLWDAETDVDALLADFYEKAYAEAASPMREYHERLEKTAVDLGLHLASQRPYRDMLRFLDSGLLADLDAHLRQAERMVRDPRATARVRLMRRNWRYCQLVRNYLKTVARGLGAQAVARWTGQVSSEQIERIQRDTLSLAKEIKRFLADKENAGAAPRLGSYEKLLFSPKYIAQNWHRTSDRPQDGVALDKPTWLKRHPKARVSRRPPAIALWIYGNDLDWVPATGAEHVVYLRDRTGKRIKVGEIGRRDRPGDGVNLCFILRGIDAKRFPTQTLEVTIENPTGGPYASRVFAIYVMPDENISEDDAQRLIERDIETVRGRALGFVEYHYNGAWSNEGQPLVQTIRLVNSARP